MSILFKRENLSVPILVTNWRFKLKKKPIHHFMSVSNLVRSEVRSKVRSKVRTENTIFLLAANESGKDK